MRNWIAVAALLLSFVACECAQTQDTKTATLSSGGATITDFKGEVQIHSPSGSAVTPQRGQVLSPDTVIETAKGSIVLWLQDGSQVLVRAHSRVTLQSPATASGSFLLEWLGKILVKAQKRLNGVPSFRMGTPSAVISVRGTQFEVSVVKHKTSVSVYEGQVEVRGVSGGAGVLLSPGYGTDVLENEPPARPHEIPNAGAHSGGGTSMRYQRESDWPAGRPNTGDGTQEQSPLIPGQSPEE